MYRGGFVFRLSVFSTSLRSAARFSPPPIPASEDSKVKLWSLPDGGLADGNMGAEDATADLTFNYTAVRRVGRKAT